jgi:3-hydroxyacyl-CoA dehydrogenase
MTDVVETEKRGEIAVIWVDNPPVNALSQAVRSGMAAELARAGSDSSVRAVVLACRGRTFIAGADITEFGKPHVDRPCAGYLPTIEWP